MSGKPSPEGISAFLSAVARMTKADERIGTLNEEIRQRNTELSNQTDEFNKARELMFKYMEQMDVSSNGNAGWENRIAYFFREMHRQALRERPATRKQKENTDG